MHKGIGQIVEGQPLVLVFPRVWRAPTGALGNEAVLVASKTRNSARSRSWGVFQLRLPEGGPC
jgi:hypothetical protein